jgi:hypothetical protein
VPAVEPLGDRTLPAVTLAVFGDAAEESVMTY